MAGRREIRLRDYGEIRAELRQLADGWRPLAAWSLAGTCAHLNYFFRGSLDGFDLRIPAAARVLVGYPLWRWMRLTGRMPGGLPTVPQAVPAEDASEVEEVAATFELLDRLAGHAGPLSPSPLFGRLSAAQWEWLHAAHCTHHFSLLAPGA